MKLYHFWVEALFGLVIYYSDVNVAIFWLFIYLVIRLTIIYEYLRKLIRVYQIFNEVKLMAIMEKLKVTEDDVSIILDKELGKVAGKKKKQLEKDLADILDS